MDQGHWPRKQVLPDLPGGGTSEGSSSLPAETPAFRDAVEAAIGKANEGDWWRLASPQLDSSNYRRWCIPSRTTVGVFYTVWLDRPAEKDWWYQLACNCPTSKVNERVVCWHKAAVFIRGRRFRKQI